MGGLDGPVNNRDALGELTTFAATTKPLDGVWSAEQRAALLQWARKADSLLRFAEVLLEDQERRLTDILDRDDETEADQAEVATERNMIQIWRTLGRDLLA